MSLKLSRRIPARTKTLVATNIKKDFMKMSQEYRDIRSRLSKPMDTCYWCNHKFKDGEMMALIFIDRSGNKILCQSCATEMESNNE